MAKIQQQLLLTLGDVLEALAPYAGGEVPDSSDEEYGWLVTWVQMGQSDLAKRAFWRCLLTPLEDITIEAGSNKFYLPDDFYKHNAINMLVYEDVDISKEGNSLGMKIGVFQERIINEADQSEVKWYILFDQTFEVETTMMLSYYAFPPIPTTANDQLSLDGEAILFFALTEYYRQTGETGSQDDANQNYENRFNELISLENIPQDQERQSFAPTTAQKQATGNNAQLLFGGIARN